MNLKTTNAYMFLLVSMLFSFESVMAQAWNQIGSGTTQMIHRMDFVSNDTGFYLTTQGILKKTTNGGNSWFLSNTPANYLVKDLRFVNSELGFVYGDSTGMSGSFGSALFKTVDGGASWSRVFYQINQPIVALGLHGDSVLAIVVLNAPNDTAFLFRSVDAGNSWVLIRTDSDSNGTAAIDFDTNAQGYYFVQHSIFKSIDSGFNWQLEYTNNSINQMHNFLFCATDTALAIGSSDIIETQNDGTSWILRNAPSATSTGDGFFFNGTTGLICGGDGLGHGWIKATSDEGVNWSDIFISTQTLICMDFPTDTVGYCGGTNGILLKYTLAGVGIAEISSSIDFTLFPNPAKESITLKDLPLHAQIKLLDANGKLLLSEKSESAEVTLDTHTYAAGIYFVEVSDGKNVTRKKVVLQ